MAIEWTEDLATGVKEIDDQHKELFNRINKLFFACSEGRGREEIIKTLEFLSDYVISHFGAEERFMTAYHYNGYAHHKSQHETFIRELSSLKNKLEINGPTVDLVIYVNQFLTEWLINHIRKMDRALADFLKTHM